MSGCLSDQEAEKCCSEPDPSTRDFIMQQTMYRIKDPKASLDFYTRILGMRLNWEDHPEGGYHNGNTAPRGFGHIGIMVPNVAEACARFEKLGVKFVKKLNEGKMKNIAFIQDPDGYWIEIFNNKIVDKDFLKE
ncbi:hypothetical protein HPB49_021785 [Dermacentor silvarum]|uniref:Uncharacterized protein n=1 Tax=Dermacentor silvarum TaxID=543639 RepID=A0ACB8CHM3_DERSI|nr:hypothetical protein HPB49_021785 [Dermacentor silvarum]